jgi:hypothetical protein
MAEQPVFSWVPECRAEKLLVQILPDYSTMWSIRYISDGISPPVTYGSAPGYEIVDHHPVPLQKGREYIVRLFMDDGSKPIGNTRFVYAP